ncbi:MAG: serine/threonine protein kinase, partial [Bryobacterales bacterium]|nr:serine/threonine protein kinase [Bryobacterales bacterium]
MSILSPESWKALSPHLDRALDCPVEERARWLETLSAEDPALAAQLRDLLEEYRALDRERFLEQPTVSAFSPSLAGVRVGVYQILQAIGEGGMGTVWLARRVDGEVEQSVAIKLLRPSHRPTWRDRFLKERQFLANLNHPAIARLLDAGQHEGQPYLIMEFVDGVPIDVYAANLALRDKIALLLKVCGGVSHAHHRLIVHRDLKPSNILVDKSGQPKLLDFGIAKLLDETGDATQTIEHVLTPNYASPEQFRGDPQTVATDIYSLGAVLFKLLTGRSPHESAGTTPSAGVFPTGRELTLPSRLQAGLPSDFDAILGKALRAEPDERYVSVDAFAEDLRAFLESRPVRALSGNGWYRARKFLRRHWIPLAAGAAVAASLSGGMFLANRQQAIAQRRFAQVRQLANRVLALDNEISGLTGATKARQEIASMTQQYLEALRPEARDDRQLTMEIITSYIRLASVQGLPTGLNLGQDEQADQSLRKAEELVESLLAKSPSYWPALSAALEVAHGRMILADSGRRNADALLQARTAATRAEQVLSMGNPTTADHNRVAERYANIALCFKNQHLYAEAVRYGQKAFAHASGTRYDASTLAQAGSIVADAKRAMGDLEGSYQSILETRQILAKEPPQAKLRWAYTFSALWREGLVLGARHTPSLGRTSEAIAVFQQAFDLI